MSKRSSSPSPSPKRFKTRHHDQDESVVFRLHAAAKIGNEENVREILEENKVADSAFVIDAKDQDGFSAFAYACRGRFLGVMRLLLEAGADHSQTFTDANGQTTRAALKAFRSSDAEMMAVLLDFGLSANSKLVVLQVNIELAFLTVAVNSRCNAMTRLLVERGADVDAIDGTGKAAIHSAVAKELLDVVSTLLEAGADPDLLALDEDRPLRLAVSLGNKDLVAMLVEAGADPDLLGVDGTLLETPLERAVVSGNEEMVLLLLQLGADPNEDDDELLSPLHRACELHLPGIAELLLDAGADVDHVFDGDLTPLILTVIDADEDDESDELLAIISLLAERGADLDYRDGRGRTALYHALDCSLFVLERLLEVGADPNVCEAENGNAPLHVVAAGGAPGPFAEYLLDFGADAHLANHGGDTPFLMAMRSEEDEIVEMLQLLLDGASDEMPSY